MVFARKKTRKVAPDALSQMHRMEAENQPVLVSEEIAALALAIRHHNLRPWQILDRLDALAALAKSSEQGAYPPRTPHVKGSCADQERDLWQDGDWGNREDYARLGGGLAREE